jgi:hypothetical protein
MSERPTEAEVQEALEWSEWMGSAYAQGEPIKYEDQIKAAILANKVRELTAALEKAEAELKAERQRTSELHHLDCQQCSKLSWDYYDWKKRAETAEAQLKEIANADSWIKFTSDLRVRAETAEAKLANAKTKLQEFLDCVGDKHPHEDEYGDAEFGCGDGVCYKAADIARELIKKVEAA